MISEISKEQVLKRCHYLFETRVQHKSFKRTYYGIMVFLEKKFDFCANVSYHFVKLQTIIFFICFEMKNYKVTNL